MTGREVPGLVRSLAHALAEPQPMRRGSVSERRVKCNKVGCRCRQDEAGRHGPYVSVVRTVGGQTRSGWFPPEQATVLRAQVEIARMVEDTVRMQAMRQTMVARLNALLDRPTEVPVGIPALPQFPDSIPPRAVLDSLAHGNRPMIRAGLEEVRGADAAAQLARKEIWPDLQVGAQYAQRGGEMGGTERMGSLMIGASVPIFARHRQYRMREETVAMQRMAEADVALMRADTRGKLGEAYANLVRARNLSQLYRSTVLPQAEATVASALSAYRVGTVDFMTLLDNQMTVNKYRQELYALDADQGKAWADLEMLTSQVLFDPNKVSAATRGDK